jgi:hypothetical protein
MLRKLKTHTIKTKFFKIQVHKPKHKPNISFKTLFFCVCYVFSAFLNFVFVFVYVLKVFQKNIKKHKIYKNVKKTKKETTNKKKHSFSNYKSINQKTNQI